METIYQTPRGHLPHQSCDRPLQKLASWYTRQRSQKRQSRGAMVALMRRPVHEQASTLARTISSRCQLRIEGNQASSEPLPFRVGCTARKYFHANISAVHVTASSAKFITCENFYVYGIQTSILHRTILIQHLVVSANSATRMFGYGITNVGQY